MTRPRILVPAALAAVAAAGFVAYQYRPDLFPARLRADRATGSSEADPAPESSTLEDGPDDGWTEHVGPARSTGMKRSLPTVRLASRRVVEEIGLSAGRAEARTTAETVSGNAEVSFVSHDYAHVTSRVAGRIAAVPADEGDVVERGQVLVIVDSSEVGTAKAQYLSILPVADLARKDADRSARLLLTKAVSEKEELTSRAALAKVEADVMNARQKLMNLGFTDREIAHIEAIRDTSNLLNIVAPLSGRLVERHAVNGEAVTPPNGAINTGQQAALFEIADLREMWAWIDVGEADVPRVTIGQPASFTLSGADGPPFTGKVELISFAVNPATRTVRVRAGLENRDERLRANQYGRAIITVGPSRSVVVVPRDAVQSEAGVEFVFVPQPDGVRFRTQRVATSPSERAGEVGITFGLKPGDEVVRAGSFLLKTELFKSKMGGEG